VPVRSKQPAGVVQEVYGLVLAHYITRRVRHDAAVTGSVDPDRLSFSGSLRVLHCHLPGAPPRPAAGWDGRVLREARRPEVRPGRGGGPPGVNKGKVSKRKKKRPDPLRPPRPSKPFREAVGLLI